MGGEGDLEVHAEGQAAAVDALASSLRALCDAGLELTAARVEGDEQFAQRGVSAGVFVIQEHAATAHHFDLRLEVDGIMRSWAAPKGPSLDPAVKRLALEVPDHTLAHNDFEGRLDGGGVVVWDRGFYEQGDRVAWPEALERGHAVFVLHGQKLNGGFALQRTRAGATAQWLLIKRQDEHARSGSDIVAEQPASILSGRTLDQCGRTGRGSVPRPPDPPLLRRFNPRVPLRDNTTRKPRKSQGSLSLLERARSSRAQWRRRTRPPTRRATGASPRLRSSQSADRTSAFAWKHAPESTRTG